LTRWQWAGFVALCVLSASGWLVEGAWPSLLPMAARGGLGDLVCAVVVGAVGWRRISFAGLRTRPWARLALASVCLVGLPAVLVEWARSGVSDGTVGGLFAMLPLVVVLVVPYAGIGAGVEAGASRLLAAAMVGLAGAVLLLPFALPGSLREGGLDGVAVLGVVLAGVASVWMYRLLRGFTLAEGVAILCMANAVLLGVFAVLNWKSGGSGWEETWSWREVSIEMAKGVGFELPQVVLLVWLLREVAPVKLAARALVVPLISVAEGYALLRPGIEARTVCGAALLLYGVVRLMMAEPREDEEPGLMLQ
jgi:hypothetical protein